MIRRSQLRLSRAAHVLRYYILYLHSMPPLRVPRAGPQTGLLHAISSGRKSLLCWALFPFSPSHTRLGDERRVTPRGVAGVARGIVVAGAGRAGDVPQCVDEPRVHLCRSRVAAQDSPRGLGQVQRGGPRPPDSSRRRGRWHHRSRWRRPHRGGLGGLRRRRSPSSDYRRRPARSFLFFLPVVHRVFFLAEGCRPVRVRPWFLV